MKHELADVSETLSFYIFANEDILLRDSKLLAFLIVYAILNISAYKTKKEKDGQSPGVRSVERY